MNKKLLLTIFSCIIYFFSIGQIEEKKFIASLDTFALANPQEKTYLQTDRSQFIAGETIWFKSYSTLFDKPNILSKVVYVTLSNAKGDLLQKQQLKLVKGSAAGNFDLPAKIPSGTYFIHAYTLWMLNFADFISSKKIIVYNIAAKKSSIEKPLIAQQLKVQFFPEGGQIIAGVANNIAFKSIDEFNLPVSISGNIVNSKNKLITNFKTLHNGMGTFNFIPENGETYSAIINENVPVKTIALPAVLQEGITINCDNTNPLKCFVKLARSEINKATYNNLLLIAHHNYEVVYMAKINFDEGEDAVSISKKNLSAGLMQITIFTTAGKPIAERIVFIANYETPNFITSIDTNKRAKNSIEIDLSAFKNADAAVSVCNADLDAPQQENNILSGLLLSSDLKGDIYQPAAYFKDKSAATIEQLDLLMLVNGWSRFNWKDVLAAKYTPLKYPFETGLSITGTVLQSNGKSSLKSGKINLIIKGEDSTSIMAEANVNSNSTFVVSDLDFKKEATIYYQGTNQKSENALVAVKINTGYMDSLKQHKFNTTLFKEDFKSIPTAIKNMLIRQKLLDESAAPLMKEVVVKSKKLSVTDSVNQLYASAIFENSDQTLIMDNGHYFDIFQYLQRMVPGITINKTAEGTYLNFNRFDGANFFSADDPNSGVQIFLNEVPISVTLLENINPSDVGIIKVFKGNTGIALGADRGAIALYTKKGVNTRDWRQKGFDVFKKAGYNVTREFYAMDYAKLTTNNNFTDARPTLYWNPHVTITNGKAIINFYNDDISKRSKVILEGIDENGKLFSIEKVME